MSAFVHNEGFEAKGGLRVRIEPIHVQNHVTQTAVEWFRALDGQRPGELAPTVQDPGLELLPAQRERGQNTFPQHERSGRDEQAHQEGGRQGTPQADAGRPDGDELVVLGQVRNGEDATEKRTERAKLNQHREQAREAECYDVNQVPPRGLRSRTDIAGVMRMPLNDLKHKKNRHHDHECG